MWTCRLIVDFWSDHSMPCSLSVPRKYVNLSIRRRPRSDPNIPSHLYSPVSRKYVKSVVSTTCPLKTDLSSDHHNPFSSPISSTWTFRLIVELSSYHPTSSSSVSRLYVNMSIDHRPLIWWSPHLPLRLSPVCICARQFIADRSSDHSIPASYLPS